MATKKKQKKTTRVMGKARGMKRSAAGRRGAATRRTSRRTKRQPDLLTRATRTIRKAADTAMGVTKTAIDTVRR